MWVFGLLSCLWLVGGVYIERSFERASYEDPIIHLAKYSFLPGGHVNIALNFQNSNEHKGRAHFIICEELKYELFHQVLSDECDHLDTFRKCFHFSRLEPNQLFNYTNQIFEPSNYYFIIANCDRLDMKINLKALLFNPGPSHLDSSLSPLPVVHLCVGSLWVVLSVVYVINSVYYRGLSNIPLHKVIIGTVFLKGLVSFVSYKYWSDLSTAGVTSSFLWYSHVGSQSLWIFLYYSVLLVIAKGWCITRYYLSIHEIASVIITTTMLGLSFALSFRSGNESISYPLIFCIVMKYIFSSLACNVDGLSKQFRMVREFQVHMNFQEGNQFDEYSLFPLHSHHEWNTDNDADSDEMGLNPDEQEEQIPGANPDASPNPINVSPIETKIDLFKRIQVFMVLYLFCMILKIICERYFFSDYLWVIVVSEECLDVLLFGFGLGYSLRMRNFKGQLSTPSNTSLGPNETTTSENNINILRRRKLAAPPLLVIKYPPSRLGPKGDVTPKDTLNYSVKLGMLPHKI
eukprot:TRINITY_DN13503_c0_g1_i1.p1 TRINITY_DN13503_c0_g1~~TRINITY_DN13503_c0_g1_i1.p1  ORF type:complete len:526 (+),score=84.75 TRINITY_DN13503_c0_g1_i1:28-1578(+)